MTILRYLTSAALYVTLLPLSGLAAFIVPIFTRAMPHKLQEGYRWGRCRVTQTYRRYNG